MATLTHDFAFSQQELRQLREFYGTTRRVIEVLYDHIMKHNSFVQRWRGRMQRAAAREAEDAIAKAAGLPVRGRASLRGNFGDIEFVCYESWVVAFKAKDNQGMMDAIKQAMNDEFSRQQIAASGF